jgi:hypothetical protein
MASTQYPGVQSPFFGGSSMNPLNVGKLPGGKKPENELQGYLQQLFAPFLQQQVSAQGPIGEAFFGQVLTPGADFSQAATAAQGQANELFKPGGQVASQIATARGRRVGQGFNASGAEGAENGILNQATSTVANTFAQGATGLEQERMQLMGGLYGQTNQNIMDMIQSLFSGRASIEQMKMAQKSIPKGGLLGLGFGPL